METLFRACRHGFSGLLSTIHIVEYMHIMYIIVFVLCACIIMQVFQIRRAVGLEHLHLLENLPQLPPRVVVISVFIILKTVSGICIFFPAYSKIHRKPTITVITIQINWYNSISSTLGSRGTSTSCFKCPLHINFGSFFLSLVSAENLTLFFFNFFCFLWLLFEIWFISNTM